MIPSHLPAAVVRYVKRLPFTGTKPVIGIFSQRAISSLVVSVFQTFSGACAKTVSITISRVAVFSAASFMDRFP